MKLTPQPWIWFNGALVPWEKAQVHVLTHALHYGTSVFEGLRAYSTPRGPAIVGLDAHVARLFHSCKILHMTIPYEPARIRAAILETVRENQHEACYIRPLVYRGYGALGVWPGDAPVEVAIAAFPWVRASEADALERGITVGVSSWRRIAPDTLPTMAKCGGNYVNSALVLDEARRHGYAEGVALDVDGYVAEGSGQNLFLVQGGSLYTPPVGASILSGFTRGAVIQLAQDLGIPVVEQRLPREMLHTADEAFFTGTVAEVTPIQSVDGLPVGRGARGPITERLQERFFAIARGRDVDAHAWLTHVRS
jgi:branched-chain amino acid aminotransferase